MAEEKDFVGVAEYNKENSSQLSLLRQGFVCFRQKRYATHVMYSFYYYMLFGYNKELFHVTCYSMSEVQDKYTESIQNAVDRWRLVTSLSLDELADVIRQDNIDILVDLAGHIIGIYGLSIRRQMIIMWEIICISGINIAGNMAKGLWRCMKGR